MVLLTRSASSASFEFIGSTVNDFLQRGLPVVSVGTRKKREAERFNAQSFFTFLKQLERLSTGTGPPAVMADNARHTHAKLHLPRRDEHFALDFLAPYSPDFDPSARVRRPVRRLRGCTTATFRP
jgi:transposase